MYQLYEVFLGSKQYLNNNSIFASIPFQFQGTCLPSTNQPTLQGLEGPVRKVSLSISTNLNRHNKNKLS
jgi:hypothetical protein